MLVMPYLFCSQRLGGRTLRSGSVDKPVMGAFCAGTYEVTPPGRLRATTSSAGPTDRPKDSSTRQAYGESDPAEDVSHILTGSRDGPASARPTASDSKRAACQMEQTLVGTCVPGQGLLVARLFMAEPLTSSPGHSCRITGMPMLHRVDPQGRTMSRMDGLVEVPSDGMSSEPRYGRTSN
jgi:hypothetical protein